MDTTLAPGEETAIGNDTTLDLEGQLVHEMTKGNLEDGEQMLQLPTGMYVCTYSLQFPYGHVF